MLVNRYHRQLAELFNKINLGVSACLLGKRRQESWQSNLIAERLLQFHIMHKYALLVHSNKDYATLSQLLANTDQSKRLMRIE